MSDTASATGFQGIDELTIVPTDFLNELNKSTSSAAASMTAGDWGTHNNTIDLGGGSSLSIKQALLWGGVALLGWFLIRKIRGSK